MDQIYSSETTNAEAQKFINYLRGIDQVSNTIALPEFIKKNIEDKLKILSPIRALSRVSTTYQDRMDMVIDQNDASSSGWVSDTNIQQNKGTTLTKVSIYLHQLFARPKVPYTLIDDHSAKVDEVIKDKITSQMAAAENFAFLYGDGVTQPHGILKYEQVADNYNPKSKTLEAIKLKGKPDMATLVRAIESLQTKYLYCAAWLMSRNVASFLRTMKDEASGKFVWQNSILTGVSDTLLGYPVVICDDMPKLGLKGPQMIFGNFYEGYQIAEQPEISILKDPYNSKPFVEFFATKRVGGDVIDFNAFKVITAD